MEICLAFGERQIFQPEKHSFVLVLKVSNLQKMPQVRLIILK